MSEKERMLAGELYVADDPELAAMSLTRRRLERTFNDLPFDAFEQREQVIRQLFGSVGAHCMVEPPFHCDYGCNTSVGDNFYANFDCIFLDVAPITIGNNVFLGPRVGLYTPYHPIDGGVRAAQLEGGRPITIGDDVWMGGNVVVCPGVTIGSDVVIGAGSVVVRDIPSHSVAVGNPCHVVRAITDDDREYWERKAAQYRAAVAAERKAAAEGNTAEGNAAMTAES